VDKVFEWRHSSLSYRVFGTGQKTILAFHGFGQTKTVFENLGEVFGPGYQVVAIDLPFHGNTTWGESETINQNDLHEFTRQFLEHLDLQNSFELFGFSIGCNYALAMSYAFPSKIDRMWLIAADGIKFKPGFWFITHTLLGKWIFRGFIKLPKPAYAAIWLLNKLGIYPNKLKDFFVKSISTREKRVAIYKRWRSVSRMQVKTADVVKVLNDNHIHVNLIFGRYDKIIPLRNAIAFNKKLSSSDLLVLEQGHQLMNSETFRIIQKMK
jgi:pimeloyl-ACP methyl ester carboxylesterase